MQTQHIQEVYRKQDLVIMLVNTSKVYVDFLQSNSVNTFYAYVQPSWVVIYKSGDVFALDTKGERISIDEIYESVPKLKEFLI